MLVTSGRTALHCTVLSCTALHCTALHCTVLHCTVLYCPVLTHLKVADFEYVLVEVKRVHWEKGKEKGKMEKIRYDETMRRSASEADVR
jgi:hypothetical protein